MSHPRTVSSIIAVALGLVITIAGVHGPVASVSATPLGADEDVIIELPPTVTVQPAASAIDATCDAPGGYTLSGEPEVIWFVDGVETSSGTHSVGPRTLSIEAAPFLGAFAPGIRTEWTITVAAAGSCETGAEAVPAEPVQTVTPAPAPREEVPAPSSAAPAAAAAPSASPNAPAPLITSDAPSGSAPATAAPATTAPATAVPPTAAPSSTPTVAPGAEPASTVALDETMDVDLPTLALASASSDETRPASFAPLGFLLLSGLAVLLAAAAAGRPARR